MARYAGSSDRLVVCLSGVGTERHEMPPFELINAATDFGRHSALFVSDQTRSWLNAPKLAEYIITQIEIAQRKFQTEKTSAIGNSMGGFMALELSRHVEFKSTLAITPQYSVMESEVPEEKRWQYFRNKIETFRFPRIEDLPKSGCTHYVIHGGTDDEFAHWRRFPVQKNLKHIVIPEKSHNIARFLKNKGKLNKVVKNAIDNRSALFRQSLKSVGGKPRIDLRFSDLRNISKEALI